MLILKSGPSRRVHWDAVGPAAREAGAAKQLAASSSPLGLLERTCRRHLTLFRHCLTLFRLALLVQQNLDVSTVPGLSVGIPGLFGRRPCLVRCQVLVDPAKSLNLQAAP